MKNSLKKSESRNWVLVIVSVVLAAIGVALVLLSIFFINDLGWWSFIVGLTGVTTIAASIMSIIKNDPSWILLGLIIPG